MVQTPKSLNEKPNRLDGFESETAEKADLKIDELQLIANNKKKGE
ncbi:hypothetical protein [Enterovibrio sp. 27052020O]